MEDKQRNDLTILSEYDRKILEKYTKFYTNFIESNTASNDILEDERYKKK
jgi:hypothetical protein